MPLNSHLNASVSVLIPCRNAETWLGETIASALNQTLQPTEVIVVDDRSSDRSREIATSFGAPVRVISNTGSGASAARNLASDVAEGDFYQFLDADDLLEPHALASRTQVLASSDADVAISDWQRLKPH